MPAFSAGLLDKLYRNTGTYASPTLVEVDIINDVTIGDERNEIVAKFRDSDFERILTGQRKFSFDFKLGTDPDNTTWLALQAAYINHTTVELFAFYKFTDNGSGQPAAGSKAYRAECEVTKFPIAQPLEDIDSGDVTCKPSINAAHEPEIYTAA